MSEVDGRRALCIGIAERRHGPDQVAGDHLAYAPRFGIELMNECDHAPIAAGIKPPVTRAIADVAKAGDLCVRCTRCSRTVDVRFWRPESGDWYLRLRDRFAAGHMSLFRFSSGTWVTDG
jgi:hypothetical protein